MNYSLLMYVVGVGVINALGMWLAIWLVDRDCERNSFTKAFIINLCLGTFAYVSVPGMVVSLVIIGILAATVYEMEPGQAFGVVLLMVIYLLIVGTVYLGLNHIFHFTKQ